MDIVGKENILAGLLVVLPTCVNVQLLKLVGVMPELILHNSLMNLVLRSASVVASSDARS